jgi:hypothetical protein
MAHGSKSSCSNALPVVRLTTCHEFTPTAFFARDLTSGLRLEDFPSLTHLTISGDSDDLLYMTDALSNASGNCIENVVINIQGNNGEDWDDDEMTRMEAVLSSSVVMPAL